MKKIFLVFGACACIMLYISIQTFVNAEYFVTNKVASKSKNASAKFSTDDADMALSIKLLQNGMQGGNNVVASPFSIYMATTLLANGAQNETLSELMSILEVDSNNDLSSINYKLSDYIDGFSDKVEVNNSIWGMFSSEYVKLVKSTFLADANELPKSTAVINKWVAKKTHNMIKGALNVKNTEPSNLYLINTIYFKDKWATPFSSKDTTYSVPFYGLSENISSVNMMHDTRDVAYFENDKMQSIKLPYKNGDVMTIFLPRKGGDFNEFVQNLTIEDLNVKHYYELTHVYFPKFEIDYKVDLEYLFKKFGVTRIFDSGDSQLENLNPAGAYVKEIIHQAKIIVDEEGTVAAAVTAVGADTFGGSYSQPRIYVFNADRPFVFMINKGLFLGAFVNGENKKPKNKVRLKQESPGYSGNGL